MSAATSGLKLGILGGAFNPPHIGHLCLAQEAHTQLALDRVLLVPLGEASHKKLDGDPGPEQRLRLVEQAVADDERFEASAIEIGRSGTSYTVDTLTALLEVDPSHELTLILGADQARRLNSWHEPERVVSLARLAVAQRAGVGREQVAHALSDLVGTDRIVGFDMPRIDVSSTLVRERIAADLPIRYLVPDRVAECIATEGLYKPTPVGG